MQYISLKWLNNADDEWHIGLLHTGAFGQLGSGSCSKGEVSVHLSRALALWRVGVLAFPAWRLIRQSKIGRRHCDLTKNTQQKSMIVTSD